MASTISSFPIDFDLYDADEQQVLFITDDVIGQELTLEVTNTSDKPFSLKRLDGDASATDHHFELVFRPGTLYNNPAAVKLENDQFELFMNKDGNGKIQPNADGSLSLFFKSKEAWALQEGEKLLIKLSQVRAEGTEGTRGTRVMLKYRNLLDASNADSWSSFNASHNIGDPSKSQAPLPSPFSGFREMHLNIVNHRGKRNIPLHIGIVGSNTVLNNNDNANPNHLKLRVTNSSKQGLAIDAAQNSKLTLALEGGPKEEEWTLATVAQVNAIVFRYKRPGDHTHAEATGTTVWEIPFVKLEKGQFIDIEITNLITDHPTGHASLYLHYENIPGYWDGEVITVLEKSPLVFRHKSVGVGNYPEAAIKMLVEGKEWDNVVMKLSKNAIAEHTNEAHLELFSPYTEHFDNYTKIRFHQGNQYWAWLGYHGTASNSTGEFVFFNMNQGKAADIRAGEVKAESFVGSGAMVRGMIVMWSGDINALPATWALCDGQNGTPDLRNRFIVGAGQNYANGATGGLDTVKLELTHLPAHTHDGRTSSDGNHQHWIEGTDADGLAWRRRYIPGTTTVDMGWGGGRNSDPNQEHWRGQVNTDTTGQHSHSFTTSAVGGNVVHENRPPYYAMAFIMKL